MRRILFCIPGPRSKELGATKVIVELAEELQQIGWECEVLCPDDFPTPNGNTKPRDVFHENLRKYLRLHAEEFDVIDYDHAYLPFPRREFTDKSLFVARSVLLTHHLDSIRIPTPVDIKSIAGQMIKGRARKRSQALLFQRAQRTVEEADLVNASNHEDKIELAKHKVDVEKVVVIPYGIGETRRILFDKVSSEVPERPIIAFVGTFDYRKGAVDFPKILDEIIRAIPEARFKLLGVQGMFRTEMNILSHFPRRQRDKIEIVMKYKSENLPQLLSVCSIGMFPSYMEGMPFGVLEMLSASIPVVAYDSPGAPMMLTPDNLIAPGDTTTMGRRIAALLQDREALFAARVLAKASSQAFTWKQSARLTSDIYEEQCRKKANRNAGTQARCR